MPLESAISVTYTADVFMHSGTLPTRPARTRPWTLMAPMQEVLRSSGQSGPRIPVAAEASSQNNFLGSIGRDPAWTAPNASG